MGHTGGTGMVDDGASGRTQVLGGIGPDDAQRQAQQIAGRGPGGRKVRSLACSIKVRLIGEKQRTESRRLK